ncbi:MAG: TonB-dependent receptor plug domain-containing protein [Verrucomicrobiota bacterium]
MAQAPARLPETVVVETRQASDLAEASPSVSRLDGAAAVEAGYTTLGGLLSSAPGVYATEQSGEGSQASLFIRGMNSTHTAVLLDGRRLPQGFSGSYELGRYRVYGLSSIELLRGPASSAYGANAIGGVVDYPEQAEKVLAEHSFAHDDVPVVAIELQSEAQLKDVTAALLAAEINIHYVYPFLFRPGSRRGLIVRTEAQELAASVLSRHGIIVLGRDDIAR